jgi:large subunit ribosomal protein L29
MKPAKIREMGAEELGTKERDLQEQLFRLRVQKSIGQLDNAIKLRDTRRDIARVKTVLREKRGPRPHKPAPSADKPAQGADKQVTR